VTISTPQDDYVRRMELFDLETREENDAATAGFKNALKLDTTYALAYAGLSIAYSQRGAPLGLGLGLGSRWLDTAISSAEKAVA